MLLGIVLCGNWYDLLPALGMRCLIVLFVGILIGKLLPYFLANDELDRLKHQVSAAEESLKEKENKNLV